MLLKFIEASVSNSKKHYRFVDRDLSFDKTQNSLVLPREYIEKDIEDNLCYVYSIFYNELLERKLYSSLSNIERAVRNGSLFASFSITYCIDINKSDSKYYTFFDAARYISDIDLCCSAVRYYYDLKTREINRYEIYGDIVLGDEIKRDESYYSDENVRRRLEKKYHNIY